MNQKPARSFRLPHWLTVRLSRWAARKIDSRPGTDFRIQGYLDRYHLARAWRKGDEVVETQGWVNPFINAYLHWFGRSDDDRALHDHPSWNISVVLFGEYIEHTPNGATRYPAGSVILRPAGGPRELGWCHRLELADEGLPVLTLFVMGYRKREWGFHTAKGWVHWKVFTNYTKTGDSSTVAEEYRQ